jgi:glycosyltransferase involved in cell wall biosynthesis
MEYKEGISVVLTVYNEEKIIERCLNSVEGVVDEIIVLHDGECLDRTLEIAQRYTQKVFVSEHKGEAELHNIEILQYVTYDWLLRLDADEFLSYELRSSIRDLTNNTRADAYAFVWQYWDGKRYITKGVPYKPAMFRMSKIKAVEFEHKNYSTSGVLINVPLMIEHQPAYNNYTPAVFKQKWKKWIKIQADKTLGHENTLFYNYSETDIAAFENYLKSQVRLAHPLLIPGWFALSFFSFIKRLKVWRNPLAMHVPFYMGGYATWLCWYIWQGKRKVNKN